MLAVCETCVRPRDKAVGKALQESGTAHAHAVWCAEGQGFAAVMHGCIAAHAQHLPCTARLHGWRKQCEVQAGSWPVVRSRHLWACMPAIIPCTPTRGALVAGDR